MQFWNSKRVWFIYSWWWGWGTCDDGIQNNDEEGIDCGGPCATPCVAQDDGTGRGGPARNL